MLSAGEEKTPNERHQSIPLFLTRSPSRGIILSEPKLLGPFQSLTYLREGEHSTLAHSRLTHGEREILNSMPL